MKIFSKQKNTGFTHTLTSRSKKKLVCGFTLIETLVAVSIFSISVLALVIILSQGLTNVFYAKQKVIAEYLSQEGIEYIRNMRDTYMLYSATGDAGWKAFYSKLTNSGASCQDENNDNDDNGCYFNVDAIFSFPANTPMPITQMLLSACYYPTCSEVPLLFNSSTGAYNYSSGADSGFSRQIKINQINSAEIEVFSTVYWNQGSGPHSISFKENLFNWIE
ncbi:hypothetical protein A3A01_01305 [Candidatus Nomurabacteria bacterium RIFCSPLOWO2_01_FULL_39_17]|uniref:Type II secretion system protein J n=1 Tax=Candidatus Nomurabacteria bacterium RIFCSPLOWO2_01_FULL_39_17 TaxID=1801770 RepID=A0A1F6WV46_9BACT|nr:MAG: hypothetical protein A3A01_01305 [Candidatus Nomurabacteria bacterium RIFCSPLOWO2_01_FULL_39_17]